MESRSDGDELMRGFELITGESGTGKSVSLRLVAERLSAQPELIVGVVSRPQANLVDFYREVDLDDLNGTVTDKSKLIAVCNPNNPSGYIMTPEEMDAVVTTADRVGAWLLADEVYAGTERTNDDVTP